MIFHVARDMSLEPHRLIKGRGGWLRGARGAGYNGGAISDGNARHVGMRRTPPLPIANDSWYFLLTTLEMLVRIVDVVSIKRGRLIKVHYEK